MRPIVLISLAAAALLGGCATQKSLSELPVAAWEHPASVLHATAPRMPDGVTAYAMAPIDTTRNQGLQTFQAPRQDYPSVGGNIMAGQGERARN